MKRILINATQTEELRVAIVDVATQGLLDLLVERQSYITKTGNIYMGTITAIEPSLDACFVNFGSERHGFLPFKEIVPHYYLNELNKPNRPAIKDALKNGQKIMVQVEKEERGNKGAALTTYISLAGSYLVLMPNNPRAGGISRRVEGTDRDELRDIMSNLPISDDMGLIVRTAGVGKAITELQWDLNTLLKQWEAIQKASTEHNPPFLIYQESDIVIRAVRDYLRDDVTEVLVDDTEIFERIKAHLEQVRPDFVDRLKLYSSGIPLFNRYQIEHQIEAAHDREVRLPSGGSIVIGHTEALVAIDVNSGQATKGKDIEQTALEINKEAARVIACQLRLRDIGGLIVIDFIDMPSLRHRREVENELRNALKLDKARTQVGTISSRFGLLEMSRQRLRHSLGEATRTVCSRCDGWGSIRSVESLALSILRMIEEDAIRPGTAQVQAQLPVDLATFIINEKRDHITSIEKSQNVQILIIPNAKLESPHYRIRRVTETETRGGGGRTTGPSYRIAEVEETDTLYRKASQFKPEEKPVVTSTFAEPLPVSTQSANTKTSPGIVKKLISALFGAGEESSTPAAKAPTAARPSALADRNPRHTRPRDGGRGAPGQGRGRAPRGISGSPSQDRRTTTPAPIAPASPLASTSSSASIGHHQTSNAHPRRGERRGPIAQGGQQRRTPYPPAPIHPVKADSPVPAQPTTIEPTLSDSDLEAYYQESTGFGNRKSAGPATGQRRTISESRSTESNSIEPRSTEPRSTVEARIAAAVSGAQQGPAKAPTSEPMSGAPIHKHPETHAKDSAPTTYPPVPAAHPTPLPAAPKGAHIEPKILADDSWVPHKIVSAQDIGAKVAPAADSSFGSGAAAGSDTDTHPQAHVHVITTPSTTTEAHKPSTTAPTAEKSETQKAEE